MWLGSPFWPTNKGRKEERKPHVQQSFKLSSCVLDVFVNFYIGQIVFFFFFLPGIPGFPGRPGTPTSPLLP